MALLREELSRKESSAQKRVDRAQKELQAMRTEVMMHVSDKAKLEEEVERWRYVGGGGGGGGGERERERGLEKMKRKLLHLNIIFI